MNEFTRADGATLRLVPGFRDTVLAAHPSKSPRPEWSEADYRWAAHSRVKEARARIDELVRLGGSVSAINALEIGCGAGIDSLLMALEPVQRVVGVALTLPLLEEGERGAQARRILRGVLDDVGIADGIESTFQRLPVELLALDATRSLPFPDASFDFAWSRAALEHVVPLQPALAELARLLRPGALVQHSIDPYYWLRGCHRKGVVDIPWAHARLTVDELSGFVAQTAGRSRGRRIAQWLDSLNQLTLDGWRAALEQSQAFEIVRWSELPGVTRRDLTARAIVVWLRRRG